MSENRILSRDDDGLCVLTLNRPEKLNALDTQSFEELDGQLAALEARTDTIGCIILRAEGKSFCAGADLGAISGALATLDPRFKPGVIDRLASLPQPVIAAVHGVCFTGGLEIALACDFIVADATARFADTHGKWGLVGAWGIMQRLPRRIGDRAAMRMMLTGETVDAEDAHAINLADQLAPEGGALAAAETLARRILANSWHTNFAVKRTLRETDGLPLSDALAHERAHYPGRAPDYPERLARFSKK